MKNIKINELQQNLQNKAQYIFVKQGRGVRAPLFFIKRTKKDFAYIDEKQYFCTVKRRMPKIRKRVGITNN